MNRLLKMTCIASLVAGAGVYAYRRFLTDEARQQLKEAASSVASAVDKIRGLVQDAQGTYVEEDPAMHKADVAAQWQELGL